MQKYQWKTSSFVKKALSCFILKSQYDKKDVATLRHIPAPQNDVTSKQKLNYHTTAITFCKSPIPVPPPHSMTKMALNQPAIVLAAYCGAIKNSLSSM